MNPGVDTLSYGDPEDARIERAVIHEVVELHPDHLTIPELILKVSADPDDRAESEAIVQAAGNLRASGLLRYVGDVIEPTHAALRAAALGI